MPHDPARIAETRGWLIRAATDIRAAEHDLAATPPILSDAVFHCQQAAEKAFKAFLTWRDTPFRKTHSLEEIGEQCIDGDSSLREIVDKAVPLTEYAWKFRYPGPPEEPDRAEAQEALMAAREVYEAVVSRLPRDTTP
ncbi:MAG: HEPN domain-containing protein [Nitrospinae bacterium]|nr:HEPN domain-containing protein [Nitrospinota bacterium]